MIHKWRKSFYIEDDGRLMEESRGYITGPSTHIKTWCGLLLKNEQIKKKTNMVSKYATRSLKDVSCEDCLEAFKSNPTNYYLKKQNVGSCKIGDLPWDSLSSSLSSLS